MHVASFVVAAAVLPASPPRARRFRPFAFTRRGRVQTFWSLTVFGSSLRSSHKVSDPSAGARVQRPMANNERRHAAQEQEMVSKQVEFRIYIADLHEYYVQPGVM